MNANTDTYCTKDLYGIDFFELQALGTLIKVTFNTVALAEDFGVANGSSIDTPTHDDAMFDEIQDEHELRAALHEAQGQVTVFVGIEDEEAGCVFGVYHNKR